MRNFNSFNLIFVLKHLSLSFRGPPTWHCVDSINDYVIQYATLMAGMSIGVGILLTLGVVGSMIIVCCIGNKIEISPITTYKYEILYDNIIQ